MDKSQAIYQFWSNFALPVYDENSIPFDDNRPSMPYITYETMTGSIGGIIALTASIWYRSPSWEAVSKKADEIAAFIGYGHRSIKVDGGYLWICKGNPFTRRMSDSNDIMVKRVIINILAEFLTAY